MSSGYSKSENRFELLQCQAAFKRAVLFYTFIKNNGLLFSWDNAGPVPYWALQVSYKASVWLPHSPGSRHTCTHAGRHGSWDSVYEGEMGLIGGRRGREGLATTCCSAGQWHALSSFHACPEGIFPTSPLCMILLDLFVSDVRLSE